MLNKSFGKLVVIALLGAFMFACTSKDGAPDDPKKLLKAYIARSFEVKSPADRASLMEYLTGDAKDRLSTWSDEQFQQAFIDSKRKFVKLAFQEVKSPTPSETTITYELTYLDQTKGRDTKVTNKKLCQLVQQQGKWFIKDVRNIKELVEYQDEMSLP